MHPAASYCPAGTRERLEVEEGHFSTPVDAREERRTGQAECSPNYLCANGKKERRLQFSGSVCQSGEGSNEFEEGSSASSDLWIALSVERVDGGSLNDVEFAVIDQTAVAGCRPAAPFEMETKDSKGHLRSTEEISFNLCPSYSLEVVAMAKWNSNAIESATCKISLTIVDVNEPPVVDEDTPVQRKVQAESPRGTEVGGPIDASDPNPGQELSFTLLDEGNEDGVFAIGTCSGQLSVRYSKRTHEDALENPEWTSIPFREEPYELLVVIEDNGRPSMSVTTTVEVHVTPVNQPPEFHLSDFDGFDVVETQPAGSAVDPRYVPASDPDGDELTFRFTETGNERNALSLDEETGEITVARPEVFNYHIPGDNPSRIEVEVSDGEFDIRQVFSVNVINANLPPEVEPASFRIDEDAAPGTQVGHPIDASDVDLEDDPLEYSITGGNPDGAFEIDKLTGQVLVANPPGREPSLRYELEVTVWDHGVGDVEEDYEQPLSGSAIVVIDIDEVNQPPQMTFPSEPPTYTIDEGTYEDDEPVGVPFQYADPDDDACTFFLTGASEGRSIFRIDAFSGQLYKRGTTDYRVKPQYSLTVVVQDPDGLYDTMDVTVALTMVPRPPTVEPVHLSIPEDTANGIAIGTVSVTHDDNPDATLEDFTLVMESDADGRFFLMSNGSIAVKDSTRLNNMDEANRTLRVEISATSGAGLTGRGEVEIALEFVNTPPSIPPGQVRSIALDQVEVMAPMGSLLRADDRDGPQDVEIVLWEIVWGGGGSEVFWLEDSNGQLHINVSQSAVSDGDSFELLIRVTDRGNLTAEGIVTAKIVDGNLPPRIREQVVEAPPTWPAVPEDHPMGRLFTVEVEDRNVDDNHTMMIDDIRPTKYDLSFRVRPSETFVPRTEVNKDGRTVIVRRFDVELAADILDFRHGQRTFGITLQVADDGDGRLQHDEFFIFDVMEVPKPPRWTSSSFSRRIEETAGVGDLLRPVGIVAEDDNFNETLTFHIEPIAGEEGDIVPFAIEGNQSYADEHEGHRGLGVLSVIKDNALDVLVQSEYRMQVVVTDRHGFSDVADLTVEVLRVDRPPVAEDGDLWVAERSVDGTVVGTVNASDPNEDELFYDIVGGNDEDHFRMEGAEVVVNGENLDYETGMMYNLTVSVVDSAPDHTVYATIVVYVMDVNDLEILDFSESVVHATEGGETVAITGNHISPEWSDDLSSSVVTARYYRPEDGIDEGYEATDCNVATANQEIRCKTVAGVGKGFVWRIQVDNTAFPGGTVSEAVSEKTTRYDVPEIEEVLDAKNMSTEGMEVVTLRGQRFGPRGTAVAATYGPEDFSSDFSLSAASCSVTQAHVEIACVTSEGVGTNLRWALTLGGQASANAMGPSSYAPPRIDAVESLNGETIPTSAMVGNDSHSRRARVRLTGANFGAHPGEVAVTFGPHGYGYTLEAASSIDFPCNVSKRHTELVCEMVEGIGSHHRFIVSVAGQESAPSEDTISYTPPVVLEIDGGGSQDASTRGDERFVLRGENFGPMGDDAKEVFDSEEVWRPRGFYGPDWKGDPYGMEDCRVTVSHTEVTCATVEGSGKDHSVWIRIGGQESDAAGQNITMSYHPPVIISYVEDPRNSPGAVDADTAGGEAIQIQGRNFGPTGTPVTRATYSGGDSGRLFEAENCTVVTAHELLQCDTVAGAGKDLEWHLEIDGLVSETATTNYAPPEITEFAAVGDVDVHSLSTDGGDTVLIHGHYFGTTEFLGRVTYGHNGDEFEAQDCKVVEPHTAITCITVPGSGRELHWIVRVGGQESELSAAVTKYGAPTLESITPSELPTGEYRTVMTLTGWNFALDHLNSRDSIRILFKERNDIRIHSDTGTYGSVNGTKSHHFVQFDLPESFGSNIDVRLVVRGVESNAIPFSFAQPHVRSVHTRNFEENGKVVPGRVLATALGSSFCHDSSCGRVLVNGDVMPLRADGDLPVWSHERATFEMPEPRPGDELHVVIETGDRDTGFQQSDPFEVITVSPAISAVRNEHLVNTKFGTQGGENLTIYSVENVGTDPAIVNVTVGGKECTNVQLLDADGDSANEKHVSCVTPAGQGLSQEVMIRRGDQDSDVGEGNLVVNYRPPKVLSAHVKDSPGTPLHETLISTSGGTVIVFEGRDFGVSDGTVRASAVTTSGIRDSVSVDLIIQSHTHDRLEILVGPGDGQKIYLELEVSEQVAGEELVLRYAAPRVHSVEPVDAGASFPTAGGARLIIGGENFGVSQPDVTIGGEPCNLAEGWSHSIIGTETIECVLPEGQGTRQRVVVTVNGQQSNMEYPTSLSGRRMASETSSSSQEEVNYDPPEIASVDPISGPTSGLTMDGVVVNITINGSNFGTSGRVQFLEVDAGDRRVTVDSSSAAVLIWEHSLIVFEQPEGQGSAKPLLVEVAGQQTDENEWSFGYDPPQIAEVSPNHGPTRGGYTITVLGNSFGTRSGSVRIANRTCSIKVDPATGTPLHTHREIVCDAPQGLGQNLTVEVQVGPQRTLEHEMFHYDPPNIFTLIPNTPDANGQEIEVAGENFGFEDSPLEIFIHGKECVNATRRSDEELVCQLQRDVVGRKNVTIEVAYQKSVFSERMRMAALTCIIGEWALEEEYCLQCPDGAVCPGETKKIFSTEGWWRMDLHVSDDRCHPLRQEGAPLHPNRTTCPFLVPCQPPEACEGDNVCTRGYTSQRCERCAEGFFKVSGTGECRRCPDRPELLIAAFVVGALAACGVAYVMNRKNINLAFMAIGIDYFQVLAIFANSRVAWPPLIREIFRIMSAFNFNLELSAPECVAPDVGYAHKWFFIQGLPVLGMVAFLLMHLAKVAHKRCIQCQKKNLHGHLPTMVSVLIVMFFVLYLFITRMTLDVFNCQQIRPVDASDTNLDEGEYMAGNTEIPCNEPGGTHLLLLPFAITSFIVYAVGFPALVFVFLRRNKEKIKRDQLLRARGLGHSRHDNPELYVFRKKFHKLYYFFKPGKWYWIEMIIVRKFLIAFSSLMFATTPSFQMACSLLVMFGAYALQVRHVPFMSMSDRAKVLEEHRLKAMAGTGAHAAIASDFADWRRQNRRDSRPAAGGWDAVMASRDSKERVAAASLYFFDYNTVEAVLLFCAVLINLAGIMFESERFENGGSATEVNTLTYLTLTIIFTSVVYFLVVFATEVFIACAPGKAAQCCGGKNKKGAASAGKATELETIGLEDGDDGDTSLATNPMMVLGGAGAGSEGELKTEEVLKMENPPTTEGWAMVRGMLGELVQDNAMLHEEIKRSKQDATMSSIGHAASRRGRLRANQLLKRQFAARPAAAPGSASSSFGNVNPLMMGRNA